MTRPVWARRLLHKMTLERRDLPEAPECGWMLVFEEGMGAVRGADRGPILVEDTQGRRWVRMQTCRAIASDDW